MSGDETLAARLNCGGGSNFRVSVNRTSMSVIGAKWLVAAELAESQGYSVLRRFRQGGKFWAMSSAISAGASRGREGREDARQLTRELRHFARRHSFATSLKLMGRRHDVADPSAYRCPSHRHEDLVAFHRRRRARNDGL